MLKVVKNGASQIPLLWDFVLKIKLKEIISNSKVKTPLIYFKALLTPAFTNKNYTPEGKLNTDAFYFLPMEL